jgi:hypothetical protein
MVWNNPISFYDDDGKGRKKFTKLYPETEVDPQTGKIYRHIGETYSTISSKSFKVDIRVWEVGIKGKGAYLFTRSERATQLVVDAHGGYNSFSNDIIPLTSDMPVITVLNPHSTYLLSEFKDIEKGGAFAKISYEQVELVSKEAVTAFEEFGHKKITGTKTSVAIRNYGIGKFAEAKAMPSTTPDYYQFVANVLDAQRLSKTDKSKWFDILTLRKSGPTLTLRDVLKIAQEEGYQEVICAFCRGPYSDVFTRKKTYNARTTSPLSQPLIKPWKSTLPPIIEGNDSL